MTLFQSKYRVEPIRLRDWDYSWPGWYFVTICTLDRHCFFGDIVSARLQESSLGAAAAGQLVETPLHYSNVRLDAWVVMPNHIHAIWIIEGTHRYAPPARVPAISSRGRQFGPLRAGSLSAIVGSYKAGLTRWARANHCGKFGWQAGFYDHILRSNVAVRAAREYIRTNPSTWADDEMFIGHS